MSYESKAIMAIISVATAFAVAVWFNFNNTHKQIEAQVARIEILEADRNADLVRIVLDKNRRPEVVCDIDLDIEECECWEPQTKRRGK